MSLALYRKYRPGTFAEVRGQEHVTEPLQQALRNGRVHHAYLFSGPRGCGKTSSARILARSLNCEKGPTPQPCGACESCVALAPTGPGSIDVIEIDAASHGGVDDARDLRERAFFSPVASRFKIYIIDEAHMVTREGFNALLKLVEEPPPHLKFVFATTEPEKVIGTIRSRTHHYPFRLMPPGVLRGLLEEICEGEGIDVEPTALPLVVRSAGGSARDALSVLDQLLAGAGEGGVTYAQAVALLGYTDASLLDEVVDAFAARDGGAVLDAVNRVVEGGHEPRRFATDLLERFRDLVILSHVPDAGTNGLLDYPADQLERMRSQADRMGPAELSRAAEAFHEGLTEMRGATSPRLLLELVCARVLLPGAAHDELALLTRLERLERRLAIGGEAAGPPMQGGGAAERADESPESPVSRPTLRAVPESTPTRTPTRTRDQAPPPEAVDSPAAGARRPEPQPAPQVQDLRRPSTPAPVQAGGLDVAAVRRMWPEVLEAVKNRRRVAWMILLGEVQVAAVDATSLTLAFAKDGDMKGFTSSGCDRVLHDALHELLGVDWAVRAVLGGSTPGAVGAGPARSGSPGGTSSTPPASGGVPPDEGVSSGAEGPAATSPAPPGHSAPYASARRTPSPPAPHSPHPGLAAGDELADDSFDVDPGLSGMALVQRELGGEIIDEIDNARG